MAKYFQIKRKTKRISKKTLLEDPNALKDAFIKILRKNIKSELDAADFKSPTTRIKRSIRFRKSAKGVIMTISAVGMIHNLGVKKHKMKYLLKVKNAKRIVHWVDKKTGEHIFRTIRTRAFRSRGRWIHPGFKAKKFIEKGMKKSNKEFRAKLGKSAKMTARKYIYMK